MCTCRFLQQNLIHQIENLDHLQYLDTLNLSHNQISHLENLGERPSNGCQACTVRILDIFQGKFNFGQQGFVRNENVRQFFQSAHTRDCKCQYSGNAQLAWICTPYFKPTNGLPDRSLNITPEGISLENKEVDHSLNCAR